MSDIIYRKKGLYYKKYGYKIDGWYFFADVLEYVKNTFNKNNYMVVRKQGIYFKNKKDFEKTFKKFNNHNYEIYGYCPAPGYETYINVLNRKLWYNKFPFKLTLGNRCETYTTAYTSFNKIKRWCSENLIGPYRAVMPNIFVMTKIDVVSIKIRFQGQVDISSHRIGNKISKKLLQQRIKDTQNDLKLFLDDK